MKRFIQIFALFLIAVIMIPGTSAFAAPELKVEVTAGIDGKAKYGRGGPVTVTVENTGTLFNGDLVLDIMESYSQGTGQVMPLTLDAGETKTLSFVVRDMEAATGMYRYPNPKSIFFYEGGWKKGTEIAHKGAQEITSSIIADNEKLVVAFTNNIDRLTALKGVSVGDISPVRLSDAAKIDLANIPNEAAAWSSVDYLIFDEYPIADLQKEQQQALLEWVKAGGIIIVGASDNVKAEAGLLSTYLPLQLEGQATTNPAALNEWTKTESFKEQISSYSTTLTEEAIALIQDDVNVLVAYQNVGQGLVMQTAFSLGDEPLAKSTSMETLWETLLAAGEDVLLTKNINRYSSINDLLYSIGGTNELFPSFKVSAPLLFGIILFYIVLIVPVLYIILKRKDKREFAWWIIPAIALLTSIAIFGYGAKDRIGRAQIQHTAVVNVEPDDALKGYYVESILSNKSGDFTFTASPETTLAASTPETFFGSGPTYVHKDALVEKDINGSKLYLRNIGYWNVASIYGESRVDDVGKFNMNLTVENKKLTGTITNDFPFALTDVSVWAGETLTPLGDLGPGETIQIEEKLKTTMLPPRLSMRMQGGNPTTAIRDDLMEMRKDSTLSFSGDYMNEAQKPVLIGYTDTQLIPISLEHTKASVSALTMITQPIEVDLLLEGPITVEPEMMEISTDSLDGEEFTQTWTIPEALRKETTKWKLLTLSNIDNKLYASSLLNTRTGDYEQIDANKLKKIENPADYLSAEGSIIVRIKFYQGQYGESDVFPKIELSGEVTQ